MKSLIEKIGKVVAIIEQERNEEFSLFAFVLPEESISWDLLAAAKWIDEDKSAALRYIAEKIQHTLNRQELRDMSGILLFETNDLEYSMGTMKSKRGRVENEIEFYGRKIKKGYIFAAPLVDLQLFADKD